MMPCRGMGATNPSKLPNRKVVAKAQGGVIKGLDKLHKAERSTKRMGK